uniref:Crossover junction endonuclease MUS81-like HHH domain-containing protein n=1 Tax=Geospiza parvula TaxID=87175 RepID=A0A8C3NJ03_GEOPR
MAAAAAASSRRRRRPRGHPNPLFARWLREWRDEAQGTWARGTYERALRSLSRFPLPLRSGRAAAILQHFGPALCARLDQRLSQHRREQGLPATPPRQGRCPDPPPAPPTVSPVLTPPPPRSPPTAPHVGEGQRRPRPQSLPLPLPPAPPPPVPAPPPLPRPRPLAGPEPEPGAPPRGGASAAGPAPL